MAAREHGVEIACINYFIDCACISHCKFLVHFGIENSSNYQSTVALRIKRGIMASLYVWKIIVDWLANPVI